VESKGQNKLRNITERNRLIDTEKKLVGTSGKGSRGGEDR